MVLVLVLVFVLVLVLVLSISISIRIISSIMTDVAVVTKKTKLRFSLDIITYSRLSLSFKKTKLVFLTCLKGGYCAIDLTRAFEW